jgi:peroxiredoxin Q/BCP
VLRRSVPGVSGGRRRGRGHLERQRASHDRFRAKYDLPFILASDEQGGVVQAYGSWVEKSMYGRKYKGIDRSTFLIDENGQVRQVWRNVKVLGHVAEVLAATRALQSA